MFSYNDVIVQLITYGVFFVLAVCFSILVNQLFLRFLKNIGTRSLNGNEQESLIRWAAQTKPAIGGISFYILFLLSVSSYFILPFGTEKAINKTLFALLGSVSIAFVIGLVDDSYNTPPRFKFIGQLACTLVMLLSGIYIPISGIYFIDALFTMFWIVGIMNSVNMLDNMDGITTSVSTAIVFAALMLIYLQHPLNGFYTIILIGVLAALLGFLFFNRHPSKMYMGDSGSQFLGAFLSFISIVFMWQYRPADTSFVSVQQFLVPVVLFMLPIIDTTTVTVRRIARGQSPFLGGRDHTTHHLAYCGLNDKQVAYVFVSLSIISIIVTYGIVQNLAHWTWWKSALVIAYIAGVFIMMQYFYEKGKKRQKMLEQQNQGRAPLVKNLKVVSKKDLHSRPSGQSKGQ